MTIKILFASYKLIYRKEGSYYSTGSFPNFVPRLAQFFDCLYLISPTAYGKPNNLSKLNINSKLILFETKGFKNGYLRSIQNYLWSPLTFLKFYKIQKRSDVVLIATPSALTYIGYLIILKKPLIILVAGNEQEVLSSSRGFASCCLNIFMISKLKERCERLMLNRANLIICRNSELIKKFENSYKIPHSKMRLVRNGIDLNLFCPYDKSKKTKLRNKFGFNDEDMVLGFIANYLSYSKGIDKLLLIYLKLKEHYPNIKLLLIGESVTPLPPDTSIIHLGLIKRSDLPEYYNIIDLFVFPSRSDVAPKVILEANSCGVPVISTNVGGIPELIINNHTGFVVDIDNIDSMVEYCEIMIQNKNLRLEMGRNARNHALKNFDFNRQLNETVKHIKSVICAENI